MNKQLRKPVIAGNWKMNNTPAEATALIEALKPLVKDADCEVVCCVPYIDLYAALEAAKGSNIQIGAENCHWAEKGAFTGEVSAKMLKAAGVPYVIIGHSERRQYSVTPSVVSTSARPTSLSATASEQLSTRASRSSSAWARFSPSARTASPLR